eukprot:scaffold19755_cov99-Amphora_coffeaeformis.AAC.1
MTAEQPTVNLINCCKPVQSTIQLGNNNSLCLHQHEWERKGQRWLCGRGRGRSTNRSSKSSQSKGQYTPATIETALNVFQDAFQDAFCNTKDGNRQEMVSSKRL